MMRYDDRDTVTREISIKMLVQDGQQGLDRKRAGKISE